jgi:hypothetical protein
MAHAPKLDELIALLGSLTNTPEDQDRIASALKTLDGRYALSQKMAREAGPAEIIQQLAGRIFRAFGSLEGLKGQRVLDIACGSSTSKAPSFIYVNTPFGESRIPVAHSDGYTAQFEPWFCRILLQLGADPVGLDLGNLDGEAFEHHMVDLGQPGALAFLPDRSFDAVQDSRLFGSPEFTALFPRQADRLKIAAEIWSQEQRLLKPAGIVIHSDAAQLIRQAPTHARGTRS